MNSVEKEKRSLLEEKLEMYFLSFPPLLEAYLTSSKVVRDLKDTRSPLYQRHKMTMDYIEKSAMEFKRSKDDMDTPF